MYIYKTEVSFGGKLLPCGRCHHRGNRSGWVVGGGVIAIAFDVEDDTDGHTSLAEEPVILPRDDGWAVWLVGRGMA